MVHFPSTLQQGSTSASKRSEGPALNATQQKPSAHSVFAKVEEELHDARRVHADGQEDDLRYALNMVINRVTELVCVFLYLPFFKKYIYHAVVNAQRSV